MKMKHNEKKESGSSGEFESKLEFFVDEVEEVRRNSSNVASTSTSSQGTTESESSGQQTVHRESGDVGLGGILHSERVKSFEGKWWPYIRNQMCTPEKLALAGFKHLARDRPSAQCVFCGVVLNDLEATSDPWELHVINNPSCTYVQLGKRDSSREYSYMEILNLYYQTKTRLMADELVAREVVAKSQIEECLTEGGGGVFSV